MGRQKHVYKGYVAGVDGTRYLDTVFQGLICKACIVGFARFTSETGVRAPGREATSKNWFYLLVVDAHLHLDSTTFIERFLGSQGILCSYPAEQTLIWIHSSVPKLLHCSCIEMMDRGSVLQINLSVLSE